MNAPHHTPLLVVLSAPSGAGKTTLCQNLLETDPQVRRAVTCTTRAPRPGERPGADYHFLAPDDFASRRAAGEFLESARVHGQWYGTLRSEVITKLDQGTDVLLNIDVQGAAGVRAAAETDPRLRQALVTVFLAPASLAELEQRLRGRGTDPEEAIRRRLHVAQGEIDHWREFDYLVLSGTMAEDLRRMRAVLEAERMRTRRQAAWGMM